MSPIRRILTAAALASLGAGPAAAGELDGTWSGEHLGPQKDSSVTLTVSGETFTMKVVRNDGEAVTIQGKIRANEKASPKALDLTGVATKRAGKAIALPDRAGIYQIQDGTLTLYADNNRPTSFTAENIEEKPGYLKLTRAKEEAKPAPAEASAKPAEAPAAPASEVKPSETPKPAEPPAAPKP